MEHNTFEDFLIAEYENTSTDVSYDHWKKELTNEELSDYALLMAQRIKDKITKDLEEIKEILNKNN